VNNLRAVRREVDENADRKKEQSKKTVSRIQSKKNQPCRGEGGGLRDNAVATTASEREKHRWKEKGSTRTKKGRHSRGAARGTAMFKCEGKPSVKGWMK